MSVAQFPPAEKVKMVGDFNRAEVIGCTVAILFASVTVATSQLLPWLAGTVLVLIWTFAPTRRNPLRRVVPARLGWLLRRDKMWSAPLLGKHGSAPFLRGVELLLAKDAGHAGAVGVVARQQMFTAMFTVDRESMVFATPEEQAEAMGSWGEVLGSLCVEARSELSAERVAWTDVHRAADPSALVSHHAQGGVLGPATADYTAHLSRFGSVASGHKVVVWVSISQARRLRLAKQAGFTGTPPEIMCSAAVSVARTLAAGLEDRGFRVGELLSPAEIARLVTAVCDPYRPDEAMSTRERFGLAEQPGPRQVDVARDCVAMDHAYHRSFAVTYPKVEVDSAWLWKPLSIDGPKFVTTVFEPVPPSKADSEREASTTRGSANNDAGARARRGHVKIKDQQKIAALRRAEKAVAGGHQELDGYTLVVVSARSREELDRRCAALRQKMREAGQASVRELAGEHDTGMAHALPIGSFAKASNE